MLQIQRGSILLLSMCTVEAIPCCSFFPGWAWKVEMQLQLFHISTAADTARQRDAFECCCADGAGPTTRRGSHVYEINTWLWNFGRPQPRVGSLSVAKTEKIQRKLRSDAAKRAWATKRARTIK